MKIENATQWAVIAAAVGVGLFVWLKPKMSQNWNHETAPVPVPDVTEEVFSSNDLTAAVGPIELQSGFHSRYGQEISQRTWDEASDMLGQIDGVKIAKSTHPLVVLNVAILDLHNEQKSFNGYGIQARTLESDSTVRVQVVEATSGTVAFSKMLDGVKTDSQTTTASSAMPEVEREFAAVADALHKLDTNTDFKKAVLRFQPNQTH
jgi:hypothetical protein